MTICRSLNPSTHARTHALTHSRTHSLTHSLTRSLARSLTHVRIRSSTLLTWFTIPMYGCHVCVTRRSSVDQRCKRTGTQRKTRVLRLMFESGRSFRDVCFFQRVLKFSKRAPHTSSNDVSYHFIFRCPFALFLCSSSFLSPLCSNDESHPAACRCADRPQLIYPCSICSPWGQPSSVPECSSCTVT